MFEQFTPMLYMLEGALLTLMGFIVGRRLQRGEKGDAGVPGAVGTMGIEGKPGRDSWRDCESPSSQQSENLLLASHGTEFRKFVQAGDECKSLSDHWEDFKRYKHDADDEEGWNQR